MAVVAVLAISACAQSEVAFDAEATAIAADHRHGCALLSDATISCWGENRFGQLGDGSTIDSAAALRPVLGISDARQLATGEDVSCAIVAGGAARCWGFNLSGQVGDGATYTISGAGTPVPGIRDANSIAVGRNHACVAFRDGSASCWGANHSGQLGDGSRTDRLRPVGVQGIDGVVAVSAGAEFTCALRADGTVHCWGLNGLGQLGDGTRTDRPEPAPIRGLDGVVGIDSQLAMTCALRRDGSVWCWGTPGDDADGSAEPVRIAGVDDASDVTVGEQAACATTADVATCWDRVAGARPRTVASGDLDDIAVLGSSLCALRSGDEVVCSPIR